MEASRAGYLASLSDELASQQRRVRQLIGDAHWGHDGRHKELLLANIIRRHCPGSVLVATGFGLSPTNPDLRTSEQDILLIDTSVEAPLFYEGGLAIAFISTIIGAISVKTTLNAKNIDSVVSGLNTVREVAQLSGIDTQKIWCGGFFYSLAARSNNVASTACTALQKAIMAHAVPPPVIDGGLPLIAGPNFLGTSAELSILIDYERQLQANAVKLRAYDSQAFATAVFLGVLIEHVSLYHGKHSATFTDLVADLALPPYEPAIFTLDPR